MAIGSMMSNLGSSAKGMLTDGAGEKAIIYLPNPNYFNPDSSHGIDNKKLNEAATDLEEKLTGNSIGGAAASSIKGALSKGADAAKAAKNIGGGVLDGMDSGKVAKFAKENEKFMRLKLQFNPASIRMDSVNGKVQDINGGGNDVNKLLQEKEFTGRTKMSFDLIFDDVDNMDAFMLQEAANINVTNLADKGINMITHKGNTFSVTDKMEAFMSLISLSGSQQIIFFWGKMSFRGIVTGVSNSYTMFNTSGNPIRGTMHLEITQDNKKDDAFSYDNKTWDNSYKKVFASDEGGGTSVLKKLTNNNILNF